MSIRQRVFLGLAFITILLFILLYLSSNILIKEGFSKVETETVNRTVLQAYDGVQTVLDQMDVKINDWSSWDDTYTYIQDHNKEYEELNLNMQAATALQVDLVVLIDNDANIVGSFSIDPLSKEEALLPDDFLEHIKKGSMLLQYENIDVKYKGFVNLKNGNLALVARPILTNAAEGPSRGVLIFGKYFDETVKEAVEEKTHLNIKMYRYDDPSSAEIIDRVGTLLPERDSIVINPISSDLISGFITQKDIYNNPLLLFEVIEDRSVYKQGVITTNYFIIFMLVSGLIFIFSNLLFIDKFLVNRVTIISSKVQAIDPVKDTQSKIEDKGSDEIGNLAKSINNMFFHIRASSAKIKSLLDQLKIEKEAVEVTVRERTAQLFDEKTKLIASIEGMEEAYLLLDPNLNIVLGNSSVSRILGEMTHGLHLNSIQEKLGPVINLGLELEKCIKTHKLYVQKGVFVNTKYLDIRLIPIFQASKNVGVLMLIADVTEEKILERSKDEFFSIASHELRTPLTIIRGNLSTVLNYYLGENVKSDYKDLIQDSYASSIQLISIVNDFLNMSKLEQRKIDFKSEAVDVKTLIETVIREFSGKAKEKNINLHQIDHTNNANLLTDSSKLREVLINLIMNALNHTASGEITVLTKNMDKEVHIEVSDTGQGMSKENQALLFHKFQQAGEMYTRDPYKGTGLGLYISKMIMDGLGGSIKLKESAEGKGSTFLLVLPIA